MSNRVPANENVDAFVTFYTIALGQLACPNAPEESEEDGDAGHGVTMQEPGKYEMHLEPIAGAYVWIERPDPVHPNQLQTVHGRTNRAGVVHERKESDPDKMADAPDGGDGSIHRGQVVTTAGAVFKLYWSVDPEMFRLFTNELREAGPNRGAVFARFGVQEIETRIALFKSPPLELLSSEQRRGFGTYLFGPPGSFHLDLNAGIALFEVTPNALRALYQAELVRWYAVVGPEKAGKHLGALWRGLQLIEIAKNNWGDPWLDGELEKKGEPYLPAQGSPEREVLEAYRDFAWQCARLKEGGEAGAWQERESLVDPFRFEGSLKLTIQNFRDPDARWLVLADQIGRDTQAGCVHPNFRPAFRGQRERLVLSAEHRAYLQVYYELYRVGFLLQERAEYQHNLGARLGAALDELQERVHGCQELQGQLLAGVSFVGMVHDLARAFLDEEVRADRFTRYLNALWNVGLPWWREFDDAGAQPWNALKPALKLITTPSAQASKLLKALYKKPLEGLVQQREQAWNALNHHLALHELAEGKALVLHDIPEGRVDLLLDAVSDEVRVLPQSGQPLAHATPLRIEPRGSVRRWMNNRAALQSLNAQVRGSEILIQDVPVPADPTRMRALGEQIPAQLGAAASALNFSFAVLSLEERWTHAKGAMDKFWICYELGSGVMGVANSIHALSQAYSSELRSVAPMLKTLQSLTKVAGATTAYIDGLRSVVQGYTLLFYSGDLGYELQRGRAGRAAMVTTKGITQIVTGASGAMAAGAQLTELAAVGAASGGAAAGAGAGGAAALGAASLPVSLVIAVGGTLILCATEAYLAFSAEFTAEVEAFLRAFEDAVKEQGPAGDRNQSNPSVLKVSEQLRAFNEHVERALLH